jgi:hypothetical protein
MSRAIRAAWLIGAVVVVAAGAAACRTFTDVKRCAHDALACVSCVVAPCALCMERDAGPEP